MTASNRIARRLALPACLAVLAGMPVILLAADVGNTPGTAQKVNGTICSDIEKAGDVDWFKQPGRGTGYATVMNSWGSLADSGGFVAYFYSTKMKLLKKLIVTEGFIGRSIHVSSDSFYVKVVALKPAQKGSYGLYFTRHP